MQLSILLVIKVISVMPPLPFTASGPVDAVIVMGVAGCGKSSVGQRLADRLGWPFLEGDSFHPAENIAKMSAGTPLCDEDRWGWLDRIAAHMAEARAAGQPVVVSCSSLKRRYRDRLRAQGLRVLFVHLHGERSLITDRMAKRSGHFMPTSLIDSQFADLEPLEPDELGVVVDIAEPPESIAARLAPLIAG